MSQQEGAAAPRVHIGKSLGHIRATAGTLGCFADRMDGFGTVLISASSVLAPPGAGTGDSIYAPAPVDSRAPPMPRSRVAFLDAFDREVAVARLLPHVSHSGNRLMGSNVLPELRDRPIAPPPAAVPLSVGVPVCKLGRTTGFTMGHIKAIETPAEIRSVASERTWLEGQYLVEATSDHAFALPGDGGALVVALEPFVAVGIVVASAANGRHVIVSPLGPILERFALQFSASDRWSAA